MRFFSLENLNLNSNKIERIRFSCDDGEEKTKAFPKLRQLHLSKNSITEVSFYEAILMDILINLLKFLVAID